MAATFGTAKYGIDRFSVPILITASAGMTFVAAPPQYAAKYEVRDYETNTPVAVSAAQISYAVDVRASYATLANLRSFTEGDLIRAEDMQFNFDSLRAVIGEATDDDFNITPVASFGAATLSARGDDALYLGFQAEENPADDGLTFVRPRPDTASGSTLVALDGDGLHVRVGPATTGSEVTLAETFAVTSDYVLFAPGYTLFEHVADPEEPVPVPTTTTTPRPTPATTTTPRPDPGFAGKIRYVNATDGLALRSGPGLTYGVLYYMPHCTKLVVQTGGPTSANGYEWWPVKDGSGRKGWCAAMYLSATCTTSSGGGDNGGGGGGGGTTPNPNEGRDGGACYYSWSYGVYSGTNNRRDGLYYCYRDEQTYICYGTRIWSKTIRSYCVKSELQPI